MNIVIAGGGKIGRSLAETLSIHKQDVALIEFNKEKCHEIADEFNGLVINGDATHIDVLEDANIKEADFFVAVTSSEEINLMSCLIAKEISKAKTFARIINPAYEKVFKKVGIDLVMSPDRVMASKLESLIMEPEAADVSMIHRGNIEVLEFTISKNSKAFGKPVKDLEKARTAIVVAAKENNEFIIPDLQTILKEGDKVIVIVRKELENQVRKMFEG
ncbi:MAG: NAD-binding protein [Candidatus Aenigmarchaeota archaeon]|nr:NAD-binding protein [Candidatus Aenigmarchaeota archaeon]